MHRRERQGDNWIDVRGDPESAAKNNGAVRGVGHCFDCSPTASNGDRVPTVDALPLMEGVDLVKIDIEGGEWALLADPRLKDAPISAIVLEYHGRSGDEAADLLHAAGFATDSPRSKAAGMGLLWAWRPAAVNRSGKTGPSHGGVGRKIGRTSVDRERGAEKTNSRRVSPRSESAPNRPRAAGRPSGRR